MVGVEVVVGMRRLGKCKNQTTLLKKFEKLMKPIILKRDKYECSIKGFRHECSKDLVADHRPSKRKNHSTFLDPRNLTTVCGKANYLAESDPFISHEIVKTVISREGLSAYEELKINSKQSKKWTHDECQLQVLKCSTHFLKNKNGCPEVGGNQV